VAYPDTCGLDSGVDGGGGGGGGGYYGGGGGGNCEAGGGGSSYVSPTALHGVSATLVLKGLAPIANGSVTITWAPVSTGTASLTYSGVLTGHLANAASSCQPRPSAGYESEISVKGTLNGTPWVLSIQSYDGQNGVWQVLTGKAGGGTGLIGQGYKVTETYPATVSGVTHIDWSTGATLNVRLTSGPGQTPAGIVEVQGTVTCG
jgi:hypothetical protein